MLQGLHDRVCTGPAFDQIQLQVDMVLCLGNGGEHTREKLRTVDQQFEAIGTAPWEYGPCHLSAP